jgi:hypothetical protein
MDKATSGLFGLKGYKEFVAEKQKQVEYVPLGDRYDAGKVKRVHKADFIAAPPRWTRRPQQLDTQLVRDRPQLATARKNRDYLRAANDTDDAVVASSVRLVDNALTEDRAAVGQSSDKVRGVMTRAIATPMASPRSYWQRPAPGVPRPAIRLDPHQL